VTLDSGFRWNDDREKVLNSGFRQRDDQESGNDKRIRHPGESRDPAPFAA
jgi:hypothetical protein